jgi:hypothetical protein
MVAVTEQAQQAVASGELDAAIALVADKKAAWVCTPLLIKLAE